MTICYVKKNSTTNKLMHVMNSKQPERQRRMCSHSYYEGFEKTWSTKVTKKVGFDVSMRLTDEMVHKMTEMDNSEPEFSIFVTNTGKRDIYTSIPFLKRYLIHNELLEHQIPRDQIVRRCLYVFL